MAVKTLQIKHYCRRYHITDHTSVSTRRDQKQSYRHKSITDMIEFMLHSAQVSCSGEHRSLTVFIPETCWSYTQTTGKLLKIYNQISYDRWHSAIKWDDTASIHSAHTSHISNPGICQRPVPIILSLPFDHRLKHVSRSLSSLHVTF
jgi:hypothetical protein